MPHPLLTTLGATARPAGLGADNDARRFCAEYLGERGFAVSDRPFEFSAWPGRWGTPAIGAVLCVAASIPMFTERLLGFGIVLLLLAIVSAVVIGRYGTVSFSWLRRSATNLEAIRLPVETGQGGTMPPGRTSDQPRATQPPIWLAAHLDSKSQPIPMALRVAAVSVSIVAWLALIVIWAVDQYALATVFSVAALLGAIPLALCTVGHRGTGALDNASGVATILSAIDKLDPTIPVGVLLTSAEELGLAGARAWMRHRASDAGVPIVVVNCDSIDDIGALTCMFPRRYLDHFREPIAAAEKNAKVTVTSRRLVPGILVDAVAFSDAGWPALTVSRANWSSLARIHSRHDNLERMTGANVESAAQFIAAFVSAIFRHSPGLL